MSTTTVPVAEPVGEAPVKPAGAREFTLRTVIVALLVAAVVGGSYPYVVMKLGFGPNIAVVSAFFGYLALGIAFRDFNRWENNIVQAAGTAAGQTAFMCVLLAAFDLLNMDPTSQLHLSLSPWQSFFWLTSAGLLGALLSVPMRQHFVVEEKLPYPDGIAAAETIIVLDSGRQAHGPAKAMGVATVLSAALMIVRADARLIANHWYRIPDSLLMGPTGPTMGVGLSWSLLSVGSGMLIGFRVTLSMLVGTLLAWLVAPGLLLGHGVIHDMVRQQVLLWVMWPATGMLVAGGLTALFLRWNLLVKTFRNMSGAAVQSGDFPVRWVIIGSFVMAIALIVTQKISLGMPVWMTATAIILSIPLMLTGLRVLGETNWGPISALSNMMQGVFGVLAPGHVMANMAASGVTGTIAAESEGLIQAYKTGHMIGSTPRYLTYANLMAIPVGAAAVSYVYPLLRNTYGLGGENGLTSPISQKWAGFARLLSAGLSALPPGAVTALIIGTLLGIIFTVLESTKARKWVPSPTGLGIGALVPAAVVASMFVGAVADEVWKRISPRNEERYMAPVASGFIAGEAIIAVLIPILVAIGLVTLV